MASNQGQSESTYVQNNDTMMRSTVVGWKGGQIGEKNGLEDEGFRAQTLKAILKAWMMPCRGMFVKKK